MKTNQRFTVAFASFVAFYQVSTVQAATLTKTFSSAIPHAPLNSDTQVFLPKFDSLLGTLLKAYIKVEATVNSDISIALNSASNLQTNHTDIAVNFPGLKADPTLMLSLLATPLEKTTAGTMSGKAVEATQSYTNPQILSLLSGCGGGFLPVTMTSKIHSPSGQIIGFADIRLGVTYDYKPVPEPTAIAGSVLALGLGTWFKRKSQKAR